MNKKYDITFIDNFKIYNNIDRTDLFYTIGDIYNRQIISYYTNHIIIYYKILNINIKIYEVILFDDKNRLIDLINRDKIFYILSHYFNEVKNNYKVHTDYKSVSIIHSNIYYYISKLNSVINNFRNKFKIKRKLNEPVDFGYE